MSNRPGTNPGDEDVLLYRQPGAASHFDELRRAAEPHYAYVDAPVHAADKRLLKKGQEPRLLGRDPLHALQLRPYPPKPAGNAGNGGRGHAEALVVDGHGACH